MDNQIFVKIEDYNEVLNIVKIVKDKIAKAKETIVNINELKAMEDEEIKQWSANLDTVSKNIIGIEESISETKLE